MIEINKLEIPSNLLDKTWDEKQFQVLEGKMQQYRRKLKQGYNISLEECREIVAYFRLVREKNYSNLPEKVKKRKAKKKDPETVPHTLELFT